jgi:hypothetical protein
MRLDGNVPAVVRSMSWNVYSVLSSSPDSLVEVLDVAEGIAASRAPFLWMSRERSLAVASLTVGHSRVTEV